MTTLTMQANPMKRSYRNSLWPQFDAASSARASVDSKCLAGFGQPGVHPSVPC